MREELLEGLSEEQIAKIKACKNQEEVLAIAKEEGIELNDEQLEAVSGGCGTFTDKEGCPKCGCKHLKRDACNDVPITGLTCKNCGYTWIA